MAYRIVFLCLQYRYEQGIVLCDLSHETNDQLTKYPTDYRKLRCCSPALTVNLTHCMLCTGLEWRLEGGGRMACRIVSVFVFNIGTNKRSS